MASSTGENGTAANGADPAGYLHRSQRNLVSEGEHALHEAQKAYDVSVTQNLTAHTARSGYEADLLKCDPHEKRRGSLPLAVGGATLAGLADTFPSYLAAQAIGGREPVATGIYTAMLVGATTGGAAMAAHFTHSNNRKGLKATRWPTVWSASSLSRAACLPGFAWSSTRASSAACSMRGLLAVISAGLAGVRLRDPEEGGIGEKHYKHRVEVEAEEQKARELAELAVTKADEAEHHRTRPRSRASRFPPGEPEVLDRRAAGVLGRGGCDPSPGRVPVRRRRCPRASDAGAAGALGKGSNGIIDAAPPASRAGGARRDRQRASSRGTRSSTT